METEEKGIDKLSKISGLQKTGLFKALNLGNILKNTKPGEANTISENSGGPVKIWSMLNAILQKKFLEKLDETIQEQKLGGTEGAYTSREPPTLERKYW